LSRARIRALHFGEQPAPVLSTLGRVHERRKLGRYPARANLAAVRGQRDDARLRVRRKSARQAKLGSEARQTMVRVDAVLCPRGMAPRRTPVQGMAQPLYRRRSVFHAATQERAAPRTTP